MNLQLPARSCLWEVTRSALCGNDSLVIHGAGKKNHRLQEKKPHILAEWLKTRNYHYIGNILYEGAGSCSRVTCEDLSSTSCSVMCALYITGIFHQHKSIKTSQRWFFIYFFIFLQLKTLWKRETLCASAHAAVSAPALKDPIWSQPRCKYSSQRHFGDPVNPNGTTGDRCTYKPWLTIS